jgi:hypothetical protein
VAFFCFAMLEKIFIRMFNKLEMETEPFGSNNLSNINMHENKV